MGRLLEKAISEAAKLPESDQEAIGAWLLAEMESEARWNALFSPAAPALERMADQAFKEHDRGQTAPLDPEAIE
jgi:hypothetical protein